MSGDEIRQAAVGETFVVGDREHDGRGCAAFALDELGDCGGDPADGDRLGVEHADGNLGEGRGHRRLATTTYCGRRRRLCEIDAKGILRRCHRTPPRGKVTDGLFGVSGVAKNQ
jgi:hypothetical protein